MEGVLSRRSRWSYAPAQWGELRRHVLKLQAFENSQKKKSPKSTPPQKLDVSNIKSVRSSGKKQGSNNTSQKFFIQWGDGNTVKYRADSVQAKTAWIESLTLFISPSPAVPVSEPFNRALLVCLEWLTTHGTGETGLFRIAGEKHVVRNVYQKLIVQGEQDLGNMDPNAVASVTKNLLNSLPETLLTKEKFESFTHASASLAKDWSTAAHEVVKLTLSLPPGNQNLLGRLIKLCILTHRNTQSRMVCRSLAVVVGPTLLVSDDPKLLCTLRSDIIPLFEVWFKLFDLCFPSLAGDSEPFTIEDNQVVMACEVVLGAVGVPHMQSGECDADHFSRSISSVVLILQYADHDKVVWKVLQRLTPFSEGLDHDFLPALIEQFYSEEEDNAPKDLNDSDATEKGPELKEDSGRLESGMAKSSKEESGSQQSKPSSTTRKHAALMPSGWSYADMVSLEGVHFATDKFGGRRMWDFSGQGQSGKLVVAPPKKLQDLNKAKSLKLPRNNSIRAKGTSARIVGGAFHKSSVSERNDEHSISMSSSKPSTPVDASLNK